MTVGVGTDSAGYTVNVTAFETYVGLELLSVTWSSKFHVAVALVVRVPVEIDRVLPAVQAKELPKLAYPFPGDCWSH